MIEENKQGNLNQGFIKFHVINISPEKRIQDYIQTLEYRKCIYA